MADGELPKLGVAGDARRVAFWAGAHACKRVQAVSAECGCGVWHALTIAKTPDVRKLFFSGQQNTSPYSAKSNAPEAVYKLVLTNKTVVPSVAIMSKVLSKTDRFLTVTNTLIRLSISQSFHHISTLIDQQYRASLCRRFGGNEAQFRPVDKALAKCAKCETDC